MPLYRILTPQWDGAVLHPAGSILEFEKGKEPRGATPAPAGQKKVEVASEPELDL